MQNQLMNVDIGFGQFEIEHDTKIGDLTELWRIGNSYRKSIGLEDRSLAQWRTTNNYKDFEEVVAEEVGATVIEVRKGRKGGTWAHLYILLKAAAYLDPHLELQMIQSFVVGRILETRDATGEQYKEINDLVRGQFQRLLGVQPLISHYVDLAGIVRDRCGLGAEFKWNSATAAQLKERERIQGLLLIMLENDLVKDWQHVLELTSKI